MTVRVLMLLCADGLSAATLTMFDSYGDGVDLYN